MVEDRIAGADLWKECRGTIGRLDSILSDLRKYGFTLITGLLGAGAVATSSGDGAYPKSVIVVIIIDMLIVGLFFLDRYYQALLFEAADVASRIERDCAGTGWSVTTRLKTRAKAEGLDLVTVALYIAFVLAALLIPEISRGSPALRDGRVSTLTMSLTLGALGDQMDKIQVWVALICVAIIFLYAVSYKVSGWLTHKAERIADSRSPRGPSATLVVGPALLLGAALVVYSLVRP